MTTNLLRMKVLHNKNVKSLSRMSWGMRELPRNHLLIYYFEDVCTMLILTILICPDYSSVLLSYRDLRREERLVVGQQASWQ